MAVEVPAAVLSALERQRDDLARLAPALQADLLAAVESVRADLAETMAGLRPDSFTAQQTRVLTALIEAAAIDIEAALGGSLVDIGTVAARIGRDGLIAQIDGWADAFAGSVRRIARVDEAAGYLTTSLLDYYEVSRATYGADAIRGMRQVMADGALKGETIAQTARRIEAAAEIAPYRAERIVRTEMSNAMHEAQRDAWEAEFGAERDEWRKMTTGPMDRRTGEDSRRIEGQVRRVDQPFEGDNGPFMRNPDRPNDRGTTLYLPAYAVQAT